MNELIIDALLDIIDLSSDITKAAAREDEPVLGYQKSAEELKAMVTARKMVPWRCSYCYRENEAEDEVCRNCKKDRYS